MKTQMKHFLQTSLVFAVINSASIIKTYAQGRIGNGGSGAEVSIVMAEQKLAITAQKILNFFELEERMNDAFPEFDSQALLALRGQVELQVVDEELTDREGGPRDCLNGIEAGINKIRCSLDYVRAYYDKPEEFFVLTFHELLGILGVEVSSKVHDNLLQSYPVSARLVHYVTRVTSYDLQYTLRNIPLKFNWNWHGHIIPHYVEGFNEGITPPTCAIKHLEIRFAEYLTDEELEEIRGALVEKGYLFHAGAYLISGRGVISDSRMPYGLGIHLGIQIELGSYNSGSHIRSRNFGHSIDYIDHINNLSLNQRDDQFRRAVARRTLEEMSQKRARRIVRRSIKWSLKNIPVCRTGLGIYDSNNR